MNKEVKELIAEIKEFSIEYCHNPYYDYTLTKEEVELLLDYINQLEQDKIAILLDGNSLINANGRLQQKVNQLETNRYEVSDDLQSLMNDIHTKTIIGLNTFLPRLEEIQDKLIGGSNG